MDYNLPYVVLFKDGTVITANGTSQGEAQENAIKQYKERQRFHEGDKVRDKRHPKYTGVIEYVWFEDENDTWDADYENGPVPNFAEVVWDISGCASDMALEDLERILE